VLSRLSPHALELVLMLALTFSTGIADAVGYLGLDKVFVGNMTGNVVILGMAIAGGAGLPIVGPLIALGAFLGGAAAAGPMVRPGAGWMMPVTRVLGFVGVLTLCTALVIMVDSSAVAGIGYYAVTCILAASMGAQAAAARSIAVADVTTVVVTSTITSLAADLWLSRSNRQPWRRRTAAILLIGAGATLGCVLLRLDAGPGLGIAVSGCLIICVSVLGHRYIVLRQDAARALEG
jgi:uncharacterized membrane protein YoaK (UPF0700 family)